MSQHPKTPKRMHNRFPGEDDVGELATLMGIFQRRVTEIVNMHLAAAGAGQITPATRLSARAAAIKAFDAMRPKAEAILAAGARRAADRGKFDTARKLRALERRARSGYMVPGWQKPIDDLIDYNIETAVDQILRDSVSRGNADILAQRDLVGRRVDDVLRSIGLDRVRQGITQGQSIQQTAKAITDDIVSARARQALADIDEGRWFIDRGGRHWKPETYARMVARTTTREVQSQATIITMKERGFDLVTVSSHVGGADDFCAEWDGKTFSLSGRTAGYPVLTKAPPFHPNCVHVLTAALPTDW